MTTAADNHLNQALRNILRLIKEANRIATATEVANSTAAINSAKEVARVSMFAIRANPLLWTAYTRGWTDRKLALDRVLLQTASPVRLAGGLDQRARQQPGIRSSFGTNSRAAEPGRGNSSSSSPNAAVRPPRATTGRRLPTPARVGIHHSPVPHQPMVLPDQPNPEATVPMPNTEGHQSQLQSQRTARDKERKLEFSA